MPLLSAATAYSGKSEPPGVILLKQPLLSEALMSHIVTCKGVKSIEKLLWMTSKIKAVHGLEVEKAVHIYRHLLMPVTARPALRDPPFFK